jgi:hypothetical protein
MLIRHCYNILRAVKLKGLDIRAQIEEVRNAFRIVGRKSHIQQQL